MFNSNLNITMSTFNRYLISVSKIQWTLKIYVWKICLSISEFLCFNLLHHEYPFNSKPWKGIAHCEVNDFDHPCQTNLLYLCCGGNILNMSSALYPCHLLSSLTTMHSSTNYSTIICSSVAGSVLLSSKLEMRADALLYVYVAFACKKDLFSACSQQNWRDSHGEVDTLESFHTLPPLSAQPTWRPWCHSLHLTENFAQKRQHHVKIYSTPGDRVTRQFNWKMWEHWTIHDYDSLRDSDVI